MSVQSHELTLVIDIQYHHTSDASKAMSDLLEKLLPFNLPGHQYWQQPTLRSVELRVVKEEES
jgi:hypothetical protein